VTGLSGDYINSSTCNASCEQDLYRCDTNVCKLQTDPLTFNEYKENTCIATNPTAFDKDYDYDLSQCKSKTITSYHSNPGTGLFLSWRGPDPNLHNLFQCALVRCSPEATACNDDAGCAFNAILSTVSLTTMKNYEASTNTNEMNLATCILQKDCGDWVGKGACRIRNKENTDKPSGTCNNEIVYYGMMNYEQCKKYCPAPAE